MTFDQHQIHSAAAPCADFYSSELSAVSFDDYSVVVPKSAVGLEVVDNEPQPSPFQALDHALQLDLTLIVLWKVSVYVCLFVCMYVCMYVCMCVYVSVSE